MIHQKRSRLHHASGTIAGAKAALIKDGWIISERTGRNTDYRLSESGMAETKKVWRRVYRPITKMNQQWYIAVLPKTAPKTDSRSIRLAPQTYLTDETFLSENPEALSYPMKSTSVPDWVGEKLPTDGIDEACATLLAAFDNMPKPSSIKNDIELVAIRTLCPHQWRRIILRDASLLHLNHFEQGQVRECHDQIHQLLEDFPRDAVVKIMSGL